MQRHTGWSFDTAFPDCQHPPATAAKGIVRLAVALTVRLYFRTPELAACTGQENCNWSGRCKYVIHLIIINSLADLQDLQSLRFSSDHFENPYGLQICKSVSKEGLQCLI